MSLPLGTQNLREIQRYADPCDRLTKLSTLLEFVFRQLHGQAAMYDGSITFREFIEMHRERLVDPDGVLQAREVRNGIAHALTIEGLTEEGVLQAAKTMEWAVKEVLLHCTPDIQKAIMGLSTAEGIPFVNSQKRSRNRRNGARK